MRTYVLRRVLLALPTLVGITLVVFGAVRFLPGNVLDSLLGVDAHLINAETRSEMEKRYGFNQNIATQYIVWIDDLGHGNLGRSAVELAKDWRTDKFLRHLEALLLVSDKEATFLLSGQGDVIEPDTGIAAIGSGGPFAQAAAQALADHTKLSSREIAEEAMKIASRMCIYTNDRITIEEL